MKLFQEDFTLAVEEKERARKVAQTLTDFVNTMGSNREAREFFVFVLTHCEHRTLQQEVMGLMWKCVESWAATPDNRYDARNEATVKFCKDLVNSVPPPCLPFI